MGLSKSSTYFTALSTSFIPVSRRRAQGLSRPAVALPLLPHAPSFPGRALYEAFEVKRYFTACRIQATTALNEKYVFTLHTRSTPIQSRAFDLLGVDPDRTQ